VTREEALLNAKAIAGATDLPVAADLENGYGDAPEAAAETIRLAAEQAGSKPTVLPPPHLFRHRAATAAPRG
jgi:2-methylisocitrate lyase-like PEP mutase family enzyme